MTTISSINSNTASASASNAITSKTSQLSETTKAQLEALGITASDGMTEAEAQQKIAEVKAEQQQQNAGEEQQGNSTESEILSDAKSLAAQVGVSVSEEDDLSEILNNIGDKLEVLLEEAENNPNALSTISSYFSQLTALDDRYDSMQSFQDNLFNAMNMVSTNNKIALGLE